MRDSVAGRRVHAVVRCGVVFTRSTLPPFHLPVNSTPNETRSRADLSASILNKATRDPPEKIHPHTRQQDEESKISGSQGAEALFGIKITADSEAEAKRAHQQIKESQDVNDG